MLDEISILDRFCGPPNSGNGGYTCGRLANYIEGPAEVTLRQPPPLGTPLIVSGDPLEKLSLMQDGQLVAEAKPATVNLEIETAPSFEEATVASKKFTGFDEHPFPTCFVCGPDRNSGDGLRLFPGRLINNGRVAAPWTPDLSLAEDNKVKPEFIWAALDCPGSYGVMKSLSEPIVLGRMASHIVSDVIPNQTYIVTGWSLGIEGRKHYAGTALYAPSGELVAYARATWVLLGKSPSNA
jgi:hypothetical protein